MASGRYVSLYFTSGSNSALSCRNPRFELNLAKSPSLRVLFSFLMAESREKSVCYSEISPVSHFCKRCSADSAGAKALRTRLEAANAELYESVRLDLARGVRPHRFLQWLQNSARPNELKGPLPGLGFDYRDELLSGILRLREPSEPNLQLSPEMVPYQPTPVRHILHPIAATGFSEDDVFIDLGSGLGHMPLLVSLLTRARSLGIEVQAAYVASARECARSLRLRRVRFISQDAREADLSSGTVFYLY
jgi:hypothetical protein